MHEVPQRTGDEDQVASGRAGEQPWNGLGCVTWAGTEACDGGERKGIEAKERAMQRPRQEEADEGNRVAVQ